MRRGRQNMQNTSNRNTQTQKHIEATNERQRVKTYEVEQAHIIKEK